MLQLLNNDITRLKAIIIRVQKFKFHHNCEKKTDNSNNYCMKNNNYDIKMLRWNVIMKLKVIIRKYTFKFYDKLWLNMVIFFFLKLYLHLIPSLESLHKLTTFCRFISKTRNALTNTSLHQQLYYSKHNLCFHTNILHGFIPVHYMLYH